MNAFTKLSGKGQVVVPKATRDRLGWAAGLDLEVIETGDAVTLRPRRAPGRLSVDDAMARLRDLYRHAGAPLPVDHLGWSPDTDDKA
ncbi:AbrB/MazE/SpoVT family DNA-binding domain-containing protein [Sphingomonas adhaesiva]|uniref:AbrB/MazE/SpoVT family DNA-binding domain-containing protein n=1 Tax=Sphingomonas adhaesiva TaxID=28212 RepID=UPI002FF6253F